MKFKKSQVFMFDLIFSTVIIIVSIVIIFSYFTFTTTNENLYLLNDQIISGFTFTKINTLNDIRVRNLFRENKIVNIENTVAQQVSEFYYIGNVSLARNLTEIYVENLIDPQISFNITLTNETDSEIILFSKISNKKVNFEDAELTTVTRRTIYGFINKTNYYGPYVFEVRLWI